MKTDNRLELFIVDITLVCNICKTIVQQSNRISLVLFGVFQKKK